MYRMRSPILWFFLGAMTMAAVGLVIALRLTGWATGRGTAGVVIQPVIHIHTKADVVATHRALVEFTFGATELPATLPESTDGRMLVRLPNGFTSFITVFKPDAPNSAPVIYHTGHEGFTGRDRAAIQAYLKAGYAVWRLDLPLVEQQPAGVIANLPSFGELIICEHRQMAYLDEVTSGHPLRYFVEPVVAAVNQAEVDGFTDIFIAGLSGGGLTTILAAAVDVRIRGSFPIAAGVPLGLRFDRDQKNWGDWEENLPALQCFASFDVLSILGAAGRSQIQVLNEFDISCYNEPRYRSYAPAICQVVEALGGHYSVHWSRGEFMHRANPAALEVILADMSSRRKP